MNNQGQQSQKTFNNQAQTIVAVVVQPPQQMVVQAPPKPKGHLIWSSPSSQWSCVSSSSVALPSFSRAIAGGEGEQCDWRYKVQQFSLIMNIVALVVGSLIWITVIAITDRRLENCCCYIVYASDVTFSVTYYGL